jgi:hypothetical protein
MTRLMSTVLRRLAPLALVFLAVVVLTRAVPQQAAPADTGPDLQSPAVRAATFSFAPQGAPSDQRLFLDAVSHARPEARRLIEVVDGVVEVSFHPTGEGSLGTTSGIGGRYSVEIDLAGTYAQTGLRGIDRVVLHELGHVVDFALVPAAIKTSLDRQIPTGYACAPGEPTGSCAPREERFAETFAKWATGDIGAALYVGYKVPPPSVTLDAWGLPLATLART